VVSASTTARRQSPRRVLTYAVSLLVLAGIATVARARLSDPLSGAWWIGYATRARLGQPAALAFATRFRLDQPAPAARLRIRAVGAGTLFVDGVAVGDGSGTGDFTVPLEAGNHELLVLLRHPDGVASLRLRLETPERVVVTGPRWRVDDDVKGMEEKGFGGARYPATLWARPPVSSLDSSSSTSSWRARVAASSVPSSSRMPSRAATE
jgi:hypothetical protein